MGCTGKEKAYNYFSYDNDAVWREVGDQGLLDALWQMLLIRNFEVRAEAAYQQGKIGGFFHAYIGQEAIQTAAINAMGKDNWWATSYRCHALALLLGATPNELMAELYGRAAGNAKGRGGSMHLYTDKLLGGFGIVTGQVPIATGAGFTLRYLNIEDRVSVCFLGDGAVAQGSLHESLNLASLWNLPCIYVIENNQWGMGTAVKRAISVPRLAEDIAPAYNMNGYTVDGMDYFACYACFKHLFQEVLRTKRPVLLEAVTERFRGHSISDPGLYRSKEDLKNSQQRDPITLLRSTLEKKGILDEATYKGKEDAFRELVKESMLYAEESPWPSVATLEQDVYAP